MSAPQPTLDELRLAFRKHLVYSCGRRADHPLPEHALRALSLALRDRVVDVMLATEERHAALGAKRVAYLSMEFLMGRALENNLINLGVLDTARNLLQGQPDLEGLLEREVDPALGNGGLGRLAACFLDSLATLDLPAIGYGINYEFGLFRQQIDNGEQCERPDNWLAAGSPWLFERADEAIVVPVYGRIEHSEDSAGDYNPMWLDWKLVIGVPHDMPVVGYGGRTVNVLRLFAARASDAFDIDIFNQGDYVRAIQDKIASETISKLLYPSDSVSSGRELRLLQEYFLVACAVRDVFRQLARAGKSVHDLPVVMALQLNDTHPSLAVAEVMRMLVDEHGVPWDRAFELTQQTLGYTNHTLLPEALEKWSLDLMNHVLPRHTQIILEINRRFLDTVASCYPGDVDRLRRMSIIEESTPKQVRMAHLSIVGSHSVNGVAALHSQLVKSSLVPDFYEMWPERFNNKTNGVTPRRWIKQANPELARLLDELVGPGWVTDLDRLRGIERFASDAAFQDRFAAIKLSNKQRLCTVIRESAREEADPHSLFDVQVKRIHEYKRQLLNVLGLIHVYLRAVEDGVFIGPPRTAIFAGKAAPGYYIAKRIIRLIHDVGSVINRDARLKGQLKVVFLPDYRVSLAEKIIPAADLSEQISTAGKEASGTGNMKLAMNGALTIGTMDGANVEIREEVGDDNIYIFGLSAAEVLRLHATGTYEPGGYYLRSPNLRRVLDALRDGRFCPGSPGAHQSIINRLLHDGDEYFHLADFDAYVATQDLVSRDYVDQASWLRRAALNVARSGKFSSDRTVREYAREVWQMQEVRRQHDNGVGRGAHHDLLGVP